MTYLTIDHINSNTAFAPIGDEQNFNRRIVVDELNSKLNPNAGKQKFTGNMYLYKTFFYPYRGYVSRGGYHQNFYKQFQLAHNVWNKEFNNQLQKGNCGTLKGGKKNSDLINVKDYKRFFKEMGWQIPKSAKKEYFTETFRKYLSH